MRRGIRIAILVKFAMVAVTPVVFLIGGTFMENREIYDCVAPVLNGEDGYVRWHILPWYPTMQNVVEILLDSPEFFSDVLEFGKNHGQYSGRSAFVWYAGSMGIGAVFFSGEKSDLYAFYHTDDDALSGHDAVRISGIRPPSSYGYVGCSYFAGNIFDLFGIHHVSVFLRHSEKYDGSGANRRGRRITDIFLHRTSAGQFRYPFCFGTFFSGVLEYDRAADDVF